MFTKNLISTKKKYRIVVIIFIGIAFLLIFTFREWIHPSIRFEHNKWIEAKSSETWNIRKKMAQNLLEKNALIGKSKAEVMQLLGKTEQYSNVPDSELYYTIDLDYGMDIDPVKIEYLIIYLSPKDQVIKVIRKVALDK